VLLLIGIESSSEVRRLMNWQIGCVSRETARKVWDRKLVLTPAACGEFVDYEQTQQIVA
jgi:hypothetical protein